MSSATAHTPTRSAVFTAGLSTAAALVLAGSTAGAQPAPPPSTTLVVQSPWGAPPAPLPPPPPDAPGTAPPTSTDPFLQAPSTVQGPEDAAGRVALEGLAGLGLGVGLLLAGGLTGAGLAYFGDPRASTSSDGLSPALVGALIGASVGYFLGVPLGVTLVGHAHGRNGGYGWSLLGELGGSLVAGLVVAAVSGSGTVSGPGATLAGVTEVILPVAGAVAAFELTSDPQPTATPLRAGLRLTPVLAASPGGGRIGLAGMF